MITAPSLTLTDSMRFMLSIHPGLEQECLWVFD
jgi:hypothetical protein